MYDHKNFANFRNDDRKIWQKFLQFSGGGVTTLVGLTYYLMIVH